MHLYMKLAFSLALLTDKLSQPSKLRRNLELVSKLDLKAQGRRPGAFIVFECLETPMKHEARVFEIASQSSIINQEQRKNSH